MLEETVDVQGGRPSQGAVCAVPDHPEDISGTIQHLHLPSQVRPAKCLSQMLDQITLDLPCFTQTDVRLRLHWNCQALCCNEACARPSHRLKNSLLLPCQMQPGSDGSLGSEYRY